MTNLPKGKEIYKYNAPWQVYSMNWCQKPEKRFKLALGSFIEDYNNLIQIVTLDDETGEFYAKYTFDHPYPTTKIIWIPDSKGTYPDLLATSGDYLRIWRVNQTNESNETKLECLLNNNKESGYCAPLTSFDWNEIEPSLIGTSSIDTTCTIWNLETGQSVGRINSNGQQVNGSVRTQLIAHDKEVCDIAFSKAGGGKDMFASVGVDGSVRMFDLRHLEHSTIIYEEPDNKPLVRLAWNKQDSNYLATFAMHGTVLLLLDIRVPCKPVAQLSSATSNAQNSLQNNDQSTNLSSCVNGVAWAPYSPIHVCTAGEDRQALIWDLSRIPAAIEEPILAYGAAGEINNVQWSSAFPDWIAICYNNTLEILKV